MPFTTVAPVYLCRLTSASIPSFVPVADVDWRLDEGGDCAMFDGRIFTVLACTYVVHNSRTLTICQP